MSDRWKKTKCPECGTLFIPKPRQIYCTTACKDRVKGRRRYRNNPKYKQKQIEKGQKYRKLRELDPNICNRCIDPLPPGGEKICPKCRDQIDSYRM